MKDGDIDGECHNCEISPPFLLSLTAGTPTPTRPPWKDDICGTSKDLLHPHLSSGVSRGQVRCSSGEVNLFNLSDQLVSELPMVHT